MHTHQAIRSSYNVLMRNTFRTLNFVMYDSTDFKRSMLVEARVAGASLTKKTSLVGVVRSTLSSVQTAYIRRGKTSPDKNRSGQNLKMTDKDRTVLKQIVARKHKTTPFLINCEMNTN